MDRAAKKGLMKGTRRGKKSPVPKNEDSEKIVDTKLEGDLSAQIEHLEIRAPDVKEPVKEKRSKSRRKKNEPKPFVFK